MLFKLWLLENFILHLQLALHCCGTVLTCTIHHPLIHPFIHPSSHPSVPPSLPSIHLRSYHICPFHRYLIYTYYESVALWVLRIRKLRLQFTGPKQYSQKTGELKLGFATSQPKSTLITIDSWIINNNKKI